MVAMHLSWLCHSICFLSPPPCFLRTSLIHWTYVLPALLPNTNFSPQLPTKSRDALVSGAMEGLPHRDAPAEVRHRTVSASSARCRIAMAAHFLKAIFGPRAWKTSSTNWVLTSEISLFKLLKIELDLLGPPFEALKIVVEFTPKDLPNLEVHVVENWEHYSGMSPWRRCSPPHHRPPNAVTCQPEDARPIPRALSKLWYYPLTYLAFSKNRGPEKRKDLEKVVRIKIEYFDSWYLTVIHVTDDLLFSRYLIQSNCCFDVKQYYLLHKWYA